jgi:hypothetical protein
MIHIRAAQAFRSVPVLALLCIVVVSNNIRAQSIPPASPTGQLVNGYWDHALTRGISMGSFNVDLEKVSLGDVVTELLRGTVQHRGDAGASTYWLCYTVLRTNMKQRLWLISDGELGGTDHRITAVYATDLEKRVGATDDCPALPKQYAQLRFDNHLWLGASMSQIQKALGASPGASNGWWSYPYEGKTRDTENAKSSEFDVTSSFKVRLSQGRITAISASQVTTN